MGEAAGAILPNVFDGVGIVALLAFTYWLFTTDRLITGGSHRRELAMKDQIIAIHEKRGDKLEATNDSLIESVSKLTITGDTAAHSLSDVARMAAERSDDPDEVAR